MFETIRNAFKIKEVRQKILMTILFVIIYRLGCYIPVPGFNGIAIDATAGYGLTSVLDAITGSALSQGTIFALGISPYINRVDYKATAYRCFASFGKTFQEGRRR